MDFQQLRQYRFQLETPFFNSLGHGIALFDFFSTFIIAYIIEPYVRPYLKINKSAYYLMLIPLGIITHLIIKQDTFLNNKLFSSSFNIYKLVIILVIFYLIQELYH
jgi:hypothetical protein